MNEVISAILNRKCVRAYTGEPVTQQQLETILQCGLRAPSAKNGQPWHFSVLKSRTLMDEICAAMPGGGAGGDCWRGGVAAILISGQEDSIWSAGDCANAAENMFLAANALGLGCCYLACIRAALEGNDALCRRAGVPEGYRPLYALTLGHAAEDPEPKPRREDCITWID